MWGKKSAPNCLKFCQKIEAFIQSFASRGKSTIWELDGERKIYLFKFSKFHYFEQFLFGKCYSCSITLN